MKILVTRPKKQALSTAQKLKALGHQPIVEPLLEVRSIPAKLPIGEFDAVILTSANAIDRLDHNWPVQNREQVPVLVTGTTTQEAAANAGFTMAQSVNGSALDLVDAVPSWLNKHKKRNPVQILYPCAEAVAHDLCALLTTKDIICVSWPVYKTIAKQELSAEVVDQLLSGQIDLVLLYSARTAAAFAGLIEELKLDGTKIQSLALSEEVKNSLPSTLRSNCNFAKEPNEEALFALIET